MKFISPETLEGLRGDSLENHVHAVRTAIQEHIGGGEVIAAHPNDVVVLDGDRVLRYPLIEGDYGFDIGPAEQVEVKLYDNVAEWVNEQAMEIANAIADGDLSEDTRNRLRQLSEAVSKGNAYTAEGLLRRMQDKLESRSSWVDVYAARERDIRSYIRGEIGALRESIPSTRFRVLATEHAPEDPERFRSDLVRSFEQVCAAYSGVVESLTGVDAGVADLYDSFISLDEGLLMQNLTGFLASLRESAESVSRDGLKFLRLESDKGDLARLARLHDLLAEGLEDYLICTTFVTALVADIAGEKSP